MLYEGQIADNVGGRAGPEPRFITVGIMFLFLLHLLIQRTQSSSPLTSISFLLQRMIKYWLERNETKSREYQSFISDQFKTSNCQVFWHGPRSITSQNTESIPFLTAVVWRKSFFPKFSFVHACATALAPTLRDDFFSSLRPFCLSELSPFLRLLVCTCREKWVREDPAGRLSNELYPFPVCLAQPCGRHPNICRPWW